VTDKESSRFAPKTKADFRQDRMPSLPRNALKDAPPWIGLSVDKNDFPPSFAFETTRRRTLPMVPRTARPHRSSDPRRRVRATTFLPLPAASVDHPATKARCDIIIIISQFFPLLFVVVASFFSLVSSSSSFPIVSSLPENRETTEIKKGDFISARERE